MPNPQKCNLNLTFFIFLLSVYLFGFFMPPSLETGLRAAYSIIQIGYIEVIVKQQSWCGLAQCLIDLDFFTVENFI